MATEPSLKEKTAKGLFWGGISNGLQQIIGAVFGIVLARTLDSYDYGLVGMLAVFSAVAATIQESGFTNALTNKKNIQHDDYNAVFWFSCITSLLLYAILFFLAPFIARFYDKPELVALSRVLFLGTFFGGLSIAHNAFLFKNLMTKERAKIDVLALFISGGGGILLALSGYAYWGLAIQSVAYLFIGTILRWYYCPWRPSFNFDFQPLKKMIRFSSKLFMTNIFNQINSNIFSIVLGKLYNPSQVGFYTQGQKWMVMGHTFIGNMINGIAQPVLVHVVDERERQKNVFRKILRFGAFVSFPLMLGFAFIGHEFIVIAIGEKWLPALPFLQLFCIWGAFGYIGTVQGSLLITHSKSSQYLFCVVFTGVLQLLFIAILFPYGIMTMISVYISLFFVGLFTQFLFIRKLIDVKFIEIMKDILPYLITTFLSLFLAYWVTSYIENIYVLLVAKIVITALVYIFILWRSNSIMLKESIIYLNKLKKS